MTDSLGLVSGLLDAHNRRDAQRLAALYAPGATVHLGEWPEPISASDWIAVAAQMVQSFPDLTFAVGRIATTGSTVMFEIRITGTNNGPLHLNDVDRQILHTDAEHLPPTGRPMSIDGVVVLGLEHGLVTHERHFLHLAETRLRLVALAGTTGPSTA